MANASGRLWTTELSHDFRAMGVAIAHRGIKSLYPGSKVPWSPEYGRMLPALPRSDADETIQFLSRWGGVALLGLAYLLAGSLILS